ncbi:MAG: hypothetical protein ACYC7D_14305 [Nitrososphaerales archaeon]
MEPQFGIIVQQNNRKPSDRRARAVVQIKLRISDIRAENPRLHSPITLLIDDPTPCINPLYYFADQVPSNAVDYHYKSREGKWYFSSDTKFEHPIAKEIDRSFVVEFANWAHSAKVKGKFSIVPYPAGFGRIDREIKGFSRDQVKEFLNLARKISRKFDVSSELLTHTDALDLRTMKLKRNISEHDWSQKQNAETLTKYLAFSLEILKKAKIDVSGVTSPCNFGAKVEGEYVKAVLNATQQVLGTSKAWYFLHVDYESLTVPPRVMHLNRESQEVVVSIVATGGDPFWTSQITSLEKKNWIESVLEPVLSKDGKSGRLLELVSSRSHVILVTHWQSLYSNGSRHGLAGLQELINRVNSLLGTRIIWMNCRELRDYAACSAACFYRILAKENKIELSTPFPCDNFTLSFRCETLPDSIESYAVLSKVEHQKDLRPNTWIASEGRVTVCLGRFAKKKLEGSRKKFIHTNSITLR